MAQVSSLQRSSLLALALCLSLAAPGCALLIPSSWRSSGSVPLTGPIDASDRAEPADGGGERARLAALPDDELLALVEADERRLVELASAPAAPETAAPVPASVRAEELRAIANRLPLAQHELAARGVGRAGARIRHPVIR